MSTDGDHSQRLCAAVRAAGQKGEPLYIAGGNSKRRLFGQPCEATVLSVAEHRGIVRYRPEEMVLTARAGTPIEELIGVAADHGQQLPFEPALLHGKATLGGTLATGLSGPARPWRGSTRDAVLGLRLINGQGEELRFGGEVIKNVAGYDVARLQAGALGTLGLISEVSIKLQPVAPQSLFLSRVTDAVSGIASMRELCRRPLPLSGAFWHDGRLHVRFQGHGTAMDAMRSAFVDYRQGDATPWEKLREWQLPEMTADAAPWQMDLAPAAPVTDVEPTLIDWAGARRYFPGHTPRDTLIRYAQRHGGSLQRIGLGVSGPVDAPVHAQSHEASNTTPEPSPPVMSLLRRIKQAMDPDGIFNPKRLYTGL